MNILTGVSFTNLHPDFKLGLLLVVGAALLEAGSSNTFRAVAASGWLDHAPELSWLLYGLRDLGALFVVVAAIWLDRRPPHRMMAAGAGVLALGLFLTTLWQSFGLVVTGMFLATSGGAFVGPLIFYAVAVKGYTRYKGALIGFLGLVFTVSGIIGVGVDVGGDWATVPFIGWFVLPVLAGGILLFLLLPRWFSANYGPGPTLRETIAHPSAKFQIAWVAAVFLVASMIIGSETTHIRYIVRAPVPISYEPGFGYQVVGLGFGIGALLWGAASDFIPVRWLLIGLAFLSLPAAACLRLLDDPAVGVLFLSLLRSGLVGLPWVLMAESLPANHVAKLALVVAWVAGSLGGSLGLLYWTSAFYVWEVDSFFWIILVEVGVLAAVVALRPRVP